MKRDLSDIFVGATCNDLEQVKAAIAADPAAAAAIDPKTGGTPLHVAAYHGNVEVFAHLLGQPGADIWAEDRQGRSVLAVAVVGGHAEIARLALACLPRAL